jgi:hypothetical protein
MGTVIQRNINASKLNKRGVIACRKIPDDQFAFSPSSEVFKRFPQKGFSAE